MFDVLDFDELKKTVLREDDTVFFIPKKVKEVQKHDMGIDFKCEGWKYQKDIMEILFNQLNPNLTPKDSKLDMILRIEVKTDDILRIRLVNGSEIKRHSTPMVVEEFKNQYSDFNFKEEKEKYIISTKELKVEILTEPVNITIKDKEGKELLKQYNYDKHSMHELIKYQGEAKNDYSSFECFPFGLAENLKTGKKAAFDSLWLSHNENFYGLGEKFTDLNKRGKEVLCWQVDALGTSTQKSYKNIPFFMSSNNYGIFMNTTYKSKYKLGDYFQKAYQIETTEGELDYYFIHGDYMKDILSNYTDITGKTPLPPKWSFGLWMSRNSYNSQQEMIETGEKLRKEEYPCDVLHLDAGWFDEPLRCDFEFAEERFPKPEKLVKDLKDMGFKMSIWQLPYVHEATDIYDEAKEKGYFEKGSDPSNMDGIIDISNPDAKKWYEGKLKKLLELGIDAIKVDFGEGIEVDACYEEYTGEEFHNLYSLLYNKIVFDLTKEIHGENNGLIWARSAYAGSQRYPVHWAGDTDSDFTALASTLKGGLSFGLSGFPFWSHDIGGYFMTPENECYIRWMQLGMFSSHARFHGTSPREPWHFGDKAVEVYKKFAELRYRLIPYIYSKAYKCTEESIPLMRPLILEYENDPNVSNIDDQYLFGSDLLVAPILTKQNTRKIYLPEGEWLDFWTKESYSGNQWIEYKAELDKMPLFIKSGSIIPMGPMMQYIGEKEFDPLTINIYHDEEEKFLYYDDHEQFEIKCAEIQDSISITIEPTEHEFVIKLFNDKEISEIKANDKSLEFNKKENYLEFKYETNGKQTQIVAK